MITAVALTAVIRAAFFILCDSATRTSGKLNLIGIFDRIRTTTIPSRQPSMAIVAKILGGADTAEHVARIRFVDTNEQDILPPFPEMKFKFGETGGHDVISTIEGLPIVREGFWQVNLEVDGILIAKADLVVEKVTNAGGQRGQHPDDR
ncbi:MAG: hypothetical protein HY716_04050 [Planctomycetes bacterium]|nr:hypothetical protein [Planctomycetota bacterium]